MRVLSVGNVYPPHLLGGYEIVWRGVMRSLRGDGHQTRVLTTDYRAPGVGADAADDADVHRELRWYWRDHEWPRMRLRARLTLERHNAAVFDRHLEEFGPDVITWWPMGGMSLGLIERARRRGIPAVLFVHDYWPTYGPERDLWTRAWAPIPLGGKLVERLTGLPANHDLAAAGRWLFNSECVRERTLATGLRIADSDLLAPGIEHSYLSAERESFLPQWHWQLLYAGRVVEQKGILTAIEALPLLPLAAQLLIVGEGDEQYRRRLEERASQLAVTDRVRFEPPRFGADLIATYHRADVVVFPVQWDEPWGLVPLEAMALGRPVVATGRGGSGDYLIDRDNALLFEAGDPASLADSLLALANDPALRSRLRRRGYQTASEHAEEDFNRRAVEEILRRAQARAPGRDPRPRDHLAA